MSTATPEEEALPPPVKPGGYSVPFPVIGIGASAGGLNALLAFFESMPSGSGIAFVVVIHLSPNHESSIDQVLRTVPRMPVIKVNDSMRIEHDHVYAIP